nr:DUF1345 domain-containing protein [Hymenobacter properus]
MAWANTPASPHHISQWVAAWDAFAAATLLLIAAAIFTASTARIREVANDEDPSRALAFVFVLVAALASLLGVVALLRSTKDPNQHISLATEGMALNVALSMAAVFEAWLLVHTVFTLRYAHIFYDNNEAAGGDTGGLEFPGQEPEPDYLDFAYFAFTIGMAAQTADVTIPGRRQRRTALLHAFISFSFNTAIVALSISAIGGLL